MSHEIVNSSPILLIFQFSHFAWISYNIAFLIHDWVYQMEEISEASLSKVCFDPVQ